MRTPLTASIRPMPTRAVDVITGADWAELGFGVIPTNSAVKENADGTPIAVPERPCLAVNVSVLWASLWPWSLPKPDAAREARDLVEVDYVLLRPSLIQ